jgi:hypothetical protein
MGRVNRGAKVCNKGFETKALKALLNRHSSAATAF